MKMFLSYDIIKIIISYSTFNVLRNFIIVLRTRKFNKDNTLEFAESRLIDLIVERFSESCDNSETRKMILCKDYSQPTFLTKCIDILSPKSKTILYGKIYEDRFNLCIKCGLKKISIHKSKLRKEFRNLIIDENEYCNGNYCL